MGALGLVKFAVYNAVPLTQWKFVMYPLKLAIADGDDSFAIARTLVVSLKFVEFVSVVPICVPFLKTRRFVPLLQMAKWFQAPVTSRFEAIAFAPDTHA
jgi:hypothetical protein